MTFPGIIRAAGRGEGVEKRLFDYEVHLEVKGKEVLAEDPVSRKVRMPVDECLNGLRGPIADPGICKSVIIQPGGFMTISGTRDQDSDRRIMNPLKILDQSWGGISNVPWGVPLQISGLPVSCV